MYRVVTWWTALAAVVAASGCLRTTSHQCEIDEQCGAAGRCEATGACSFPATDCAGGRRYGEATGPLAGLCVGDEPDAAVPPPPDGPSDPDGAPVPDFYGDGRDGDFTTTSADARVNTYAALVLDAPAGATTLTIANRTLANSGGWTRDFAAGDLVMVFQATGAPDLASGSPAPLVLAGPVGRYHVSRLTAKTPVTVTLADPLPVAFASQVTQVIKIPQLRQVSVGAGGAVRAAPWNGSVGGVVALVADSLVLDAARLDADSRGFRGGPVVEQGDFSGCSALDGTSDTGGGAAKGESVVPTRYDGEASTSGRGNVHTGAGGGNCHNAGGGGGGGAGAGGRGGNDKDNAAVGGLGGAPLQLDPRTHLGFGGGAGAGEDDTNQGTAGGDGGGVVWIKVKTITCTGGGALSATGDTQDTAAGTDGAGGGGGGGLLWIRAESITGCRLIASGGGGGDAASSYGPGGGGGGGRVLLIAGSRPGTSIVVDGGPAGDAGGGGARNATAGASGAVCGNGTREAGETCDDGTTTPGGSCTYCSE